MKEIRCSSELTVTIRDIAREVGVCHATVSLALRNDPRISASRRKEIHEAALRMHYRPNAMASLLGQRRHHVSDDTFKAEIAWITTAENRGTFRVYREFERYWDGAARAAEARGYHLQEFLCDAGTPPSRLEKILRARNIQGIIMAPQRGLAPDWSGFPWEEFAAVRFGYSVRSPNVNLVTSDQLANSMLAAEKMRSLGYTRLGFVTGSAGHPRFQAGFFQFQIELQRALQLPHLILPEGPDPAPNLARLASWIKRTHPQAILTDSGSMRSMIEACGYRVPNEIGLAGLSVLDVDTDAGIDQNSEDIGRVAVETLLSLIQENRFGIPPLPRETLIRGTWVDGTSLPGLRHPAATPVGFG